MGVVCCDGGGNEGGMLVGNEGLGGDVGSNKMGVRHNCEGNTTTRPLLLSEILQKGKLMEYEHTID